MMMICDDDKSSGDSNLHPSHAAMSLSFNFMGGASRYNQSGWRNMHNMNSSNAEHQSDHYLPPKNLSYSAQV